MVDLNASVGTDSNDSARQVGSKPFNTPTNANDGSSGTKSYISSGLDSFTSYIKADLGSDYECTAFKLYLSNTPTLLDQFQYSTNGTTWVTLTGTETGTRSLSPDGATFTFTAPITARYWACRASATGFHSSLYFNTWQIIGTPPAGPPVVANFSGTPRSGVPPLQVVFTDASTGNPNQWSWTFGDSGTSTSQNPTHTYTVAGTYTVTLTATRTSDMSSDSETKTFYVVVGAAGVYIDWGSDGFNVGDYDNVSSRVLSWTITRGAAPEITGGATPGSATIVLDNAGDLYNPRNASSPIYASLRDGPPVWIGVNADGVLTGNDPRGLFGGRITDITLIPSPGTADPATVEIQCEDMLSWARRMPIRLDHAEGRSHRQLRLDALTEAAETRQSLDNEIHTMPLSHADADLLSVLDAINSVNGTRHFAKPEDSFTDWYTYTTYNRLQRLAGVADATLNAGSQKVTGSDGWRLSADTVINQQKATVTPVEFTPATFTVWQAEDLPLGLTTARGYNRIVDFDDVVRDQVLDIASTGSTVVQTFTPFATSAKIVLSVASGSATVTALSVEGRLARRLPSESYLADDLTSQAAPRGIREGGEIGNEYLGVMASAGGIAEHVVWRYGTPQLRPTLTVENWVPSQFDRDLYEIISLTSTHLGLTNRLFEIVGLTHEGHRAASTSVYHHVTRYVLQECKVQTATSWFTLNSSLLNGAHTLAY